MLDYVLEEQALEEIEDNLEWPQVWDFYSDTDSPMARVMWYSEIICTVLNYTDKLDTNDEPNFCVGYTTNCTGGSPWQSPEAWKLVSKGFKW